MFSFLNDSSTSSNLRGYHTNNIYKGFPPLMNDSRAVIASWQPEASINNQILKKQQIKSNWEYRKYLQENASEIMKYNMDEACNDSGYFIPDIRNAGSTASVSHPINYRSFQEPSKNMDPSISDLKQIYLSKEQLEARKISPSITQSQLIQSWGAFAKPSSPA
jgi:hypothetical protein